MNPDPNRAYAPAGVKTMPGMAGRIGLRLAGALALIGAYIVLEWVSFIHEYKGLPITPWNPGVGLVFAHLIRTSAWSGLILFAGVLLAEILVVDSVLDLTEIVVVAVLIAAGYAGAAALARRWRIDVNMTGLNDVLLVLGTGLGGAIFVASALTGFFLVRGQIGFADVVPAALPLLIGDVIGIAVVTPLLLRLSHFTSMPGDWRPGTGVVIEFAFYALVIVAFLSLTIGEERSGGFNYFYLIFLPVVAAALRQGLDGACFSLVIAQLGLVGLMHRHGFDVSTFTEYQSLMLVLSATGLIVGVVVAERSQAERAARAAQENLKALEADAIQASRFNLVTGMASALAHEINQPMTAARALARSSEYLLTSPDGDRARAAENLADLVVQIDHAGEIVRRMRGFLRRGVPRSSTIDVSNLLNDAVMLARAAAVERKAAIIVETAEPLPSTHGDHIQVQQVVLNLIHNALDAIKETGRRDGKIVLTARSVPESRRIEISVRDNGAGIGADVAQRLFRPLTTSKPEGLGLGLSICATIVESHGGRIWLHCGDPGATEFRFYLPVPAGTGSGT
jgi:signal transduction histidine kinase